MNTKPIVFGIIGFLLGGLLVSLGGTIIHKRGGTALNNMTMSSMTTSLQGKTGDAFDTAFLSEMIDHHQAAIDMAKLASQNAKHQEIKDIANTIMTAQTNEIIRMRNWQRQWGY